MTELQDSMLSSMQVSSACSTLMKVDLVALKIFPPIGPSKQTGYWALGIFFGSHHDFLDAKMMFQKLA